MVEVYIYHNFWWISPAYIMSERIMDTYSTPQIFNSIEHHRWHQSSKSDIILYLWCVYLTVDRVPDIETYRNTDIVEDPNSCTGTGDVKVHYVISTMWYRESREISESKPEVLFHVSDQVGSRVAATYHSQGDCQPPGGHLRT